METADYKSLDNIRQSEPLTFNLYHIENHEATVQSGSLKSYSVKEDGSAIYARQSSGYSITVERLLWLDGWENTHIDDLENTKRGQEMTLVVLKIVFVSHDSQRKFSQAQISLVFEDSNGEVTKGENEPTVQAWGPFHKSEKWNASRAQHTRSDKKEGSIQLSYSGAGLSGTLGREDTLSWNRMAFDKGLATAQTSQITGNRNGVTWSLQQNEIENAGITQEFWAAVLISRPTAEPYLVRFQVNARAGTKQDFMNKTKRFFGLNPNETKPFLVTPGKGEICNYEGKDIRKCVDINNLGKLRHQENSSRLDVKWGPDYRVEAPIPSTGIDNQPLAREKESLSINKAAEELPSSAPLLTSTKEPQVPPFLQGLQSSETATTAIDSAPGFPQAPQWSSPQVLSLPPLVVGWQNPTPATNTDSARITALEARMAQLEARLAEQDSLIMRGYNRRYAYATRKTRG